MTSSVIQIFSPVVVDQFYINGDVTKIYKINMFNLSGSCDNFTYQLDILPIVSNHTIITFDQISN